MESVMQGNLVSNSCTVTLPELSSLADRRLELHSHMHFSGVVEEDCYFFLVCSIGDYLGVWVFGSAPGRGTVL